MALEFLPAPKEFNPEEPCLVLLQRRKSQNLDTPQTIKTLPINDSREKCFVAIRCRISNHTASSCRTTNSFSCEDIFLVVFKPRWKAYSVPFVSLLDPKQPKPGKRDHVAFRQQRPSQNCDTLHKKQSKSCNLPDKSVPTCRVFGRCPFSKKQSQLWYLLVHKTILT